VYQKNAFIIRASVQLDNRRVPKAFGFDAIGNPRPEFSQGGLFLCK
jgi:hypothetical protein